MSVQSVTYIERNEGGDVGYDNATYEATPVLTVFMPVANVERTRNGSIDDATSVMQCIRASNFSEGSRVAPALPEGTPWPDRNGLSAGAKGGIAAGVVGFALILAGLGLWLVKRKKRARAVAAAAVVAKGQADSQPSGDDKKLPPEANGDGAVHELTPRDRKPEIDSADVSELGGGIGKASELAGTSAPVELPAENARTQRRWEDFARL